MADNKQQSPNLRMLAESYKKIIFLIMSRKDDKIVYAISNYTLIHYSKSKTFSMRIRVAVGRKVSRRCRADVAMSNLSVTRCTKNTALRPSLLKKIYQLRPWTVHEVIKNNQHHR